MGRSLAAAGICAALAAGQLSCRTERRNPVPAEPERFEPKRVETGGVSRWAHVITGSRELSLPCPRPEGRELVFDAARLGSPHSGIDLEISWIDRQAVETTLFRWSSSGSNVHHWSEIRVPLVDKDSGIVRLRLTPETFPKDSVAVAAPRFEPTPTPLTVKQQRPNLALIVLDTFRYDYISRYGPNPTATPNLDRFLAGAIEFLDAYTRTTFTLPSHVSMMTGLPPRSHGVRTNLQVLDRSVRTIPLLLQGIGYRTGGFCEIGTLSEQTGFARGFDTYVMCRDYSHRVLSSVASWLQTVGDSPFFLFVNLAGVHVARAQPSDVHQLTCGLAGEAGFHLRADREMEVVRFVLPPGLSTLEFGAGRSSDAGRRVDDRPLPMAIWDLRVSPEGTLEWCWAPDVERPELVRFLLEPPDWTDQDIVFRGRTTFRITNVGQDTTVATLRFRAYPDFSQALDQDRTQYALATAALDETVGKLLAVLDRYSNPGRTIVVLTSDHGEGLEDHRDRLHGHEVFVETAHVPLALRLPGGKPRSVRGLVSLDAIAPTILDFAGCANPPDMTEKALFDDGREASGRLLSEAYDARSAAAQIPRARDRALRTADWSLVLDEVRGLTCLFDRRTDLKESTNLAGQWPGLVDSLTVLLEQATREQQALYRPGSLSEDPELRRQLRALGYIE